jgi:signal transduction histidine kinase
VLENSERVLIHIDLAGGEWTDGATETASMLTLMRSMVRNIVHLQDVHTRLTNRLHRRRKGTGRRAVEQLENERARLGSELHTGVGQQLTAIGFQLDIIERVPAPLPVPVQDALGKIRTLTAKAHDQARSLSHWLHPPEWQRLSLFDALGQLWELSGIPEMFGDRAVLRRVPLSAEPYLAAKKLLYRSAQELLQNAVRHSGATHLTMSLEERGGKYRLVIEDDGKGLDLDQIAIGEASLKKGIGLRTLREQLYANNGEFRVTSGSSGTRIEIVLPVRDPGEV